MLFNSVLFMLFFLPAAMLLYWLAPGKAKNTVLLLESLLFYAFGNLKYLPLAVGIVLVNYLSALWIGQTDGKPGIRKLLLVTALALNLLLLAAFKYGAYLTEFLNSLTRGDVTFFLVLPLGISYYLFKMLSYLCDVYTGKCPPEKNFIDFSTYVLMYQQMVVGPIIRYTDIRAELQERNRTIQPEKMLEGTRLFVYGLAKKVILADALGLLWNQIAGEGGIGLTQASSALVWLGVVAFSLQLYLDFSGYSEMSNGLSALMGFSCKANFQYPYRADSVTDFWRRWHITLSQWFRDYVYILLGGNRKGAARQIFNMLVVWLLTGIWHGSTGNFVVWGLYYFLFLILEKYVWKNFLQKQKWFGHLYTLVIVAVGWGIFAADGSQISVLPLLGKLFGFSSGVSAGYFLRCYGVILLLSMAVSGGIFERFRQKLEKRRWLETLWLVAIFIGSLAYIVGSTGRAALYAGF